MSQRQELVALARRDGVGIAELARRFGVSRKTVYKWLLRHGEAGSQGLMDRSRRPRRSPKRTPPALERAVLELRAKHPAWGGRKLHRRLRTLGVDAPAPSTITRILHDHGLIDSAASAERQPWRRFERASPNELWQMDFKSPVALVNGAASHPLTVIDDHSRYALGVHACMDQRHATVQTRLTHLFERFGLPWAILSDNGVPWRAPGLAAYSRLEVWLMRLDIGVRHGRLYHPQTQGKDERFHRTMQVELLQGRSFADHWALQSALTPWRDVYNHERPHEALDMATPAQRYRPSPRPLPSTLPALEYAAGDQVRRVDSSGRIYFEGRRFRAGKALAGLTVGVRRTKTDGQWTVYLGRFAIGRADLTSTARDRRDYVLAPVSARCARSDGGQDVDQL